MPSHANGNNAAEKLRAAFSGIGVAEDDERRLALLKQHGFNAALVCDSGLAVNIPRWKELGRLADQYDLRLFPIYTFAGTAEITAWLGSFAPYTMPDGTPTERTPCPLNAEYWDQSVAARWEQLALLSTQVPLAGLLIDTEMYGGNIAVYEQPCLCDQCWQEFVFAFAAANPEHAAVIEQAQLPAAQRNRFLTQQRLWPQYTAIQEQRLQRLAAQIERRIHRINPALELGIMAYVDSWFYHSLIRGLGTSTQPVNVFSETFYIRGWSPDVLTEQTTIKQDGVAQYLPGLWQGRFFPEDLSAQASELAKQTDGYWLFSADSLWTDKPKSGHYTLHGMPAEYWTAWNKANVMIRQGQQDAAPFLSSVYEPEAQRLQTPPLLETLLFDIKDHHVIAQDTAHIVYEKDVLFHFLSRPESAIRMTPVILSEQQTEPITYRLFDESGTLAQTGTCANTFELTLPPNVSGMMSLLIVAQNQGVRVAFDSMPWVVEASVSFPFVTRSSPLTMSYAIAPTQDAIRFKVSSGTSEPASLVIGSPEKADLYRLQFEDFGELRFAINETAKERRQAFWNMTINASDSAATRWHYFYQTPLPYFMPKRI